MVGPSEAEELPFHLTRWQPSDWLLVALAAAGLVLFFPFFNRTSLGPRSKVSFDRSVLRRIAQEYAQRLGAPVGGGSQIDNWDRIRRYDYVAQAAGPRAALELANNPVPYFEWEVQWENGTQVVVDNRGSLVSFLRQFPSRTSTEKLSVEKARPLAEKALRDFLNRDPSLLRLESAIGDTYYEHPAVSFTWSDATDYHGIKRSEVVRFVSKEIATLESKYDLPTGYTMRDVGWQILPAVALNVVLLFMGWSQKQHVDLKATWRVFGVVLYL